MEIITSSKKKKKLLTDAEYLGHYTNTKTNNSRLKKEEKECQQKDSESFLT